MQTTKLNLLELIDESFEKIRQFFSSRVSSIEDSEDLTQDVCCAIVDSYGRFRGASSQSTWVFAICKHHLYKYYRRKKRSCDTIARLVDQRRSGAEPCESLLDMACDGLSAQQQSLYTEYYHLHKSIREIAVDLKKPEGTVKYLLHVLRRDLRRLAS